jgi:hypothetical protein
MRFTFNCPYSRDGTDNFYWVTRRSFFILRRTMVFQGSELICEVCEKTFPRKEMVFSVKNNISICEGCLRNWRLGGGVCVACSEPVHRNHVWGFFREKKAFGHFECGGVEIDLSSVHAYFKTDGEAFTWALFGEELIEGQPLKYCEFRIASDPRGPGEDGAEYRIGDHVLCQAGGNFSLGTVGRDTERIIQICQSCDIPMSMSKGTSPCLHLIPFRVFNGSEVLSYYACQWFFSFDPKGAHKQRESQCEGNCLFWFQRPKNKPRVFDPKCEKFLKMFLEAKPSPRLFPPEQDRLSPLWKRCWNAIMALIPSKNS